MNKNTPLTVAGILFSLVALLHLLRLVFHISVEIGVVPLPEWVSWIGVIVPFILAVWMFRASRE